MLMITAMIGVLLIVEIGQVFTFGYDEMEGGGAQSSPEKGSDERRLKLGPHDTCLLLPINFGALEP